MPLLMRLIVENLSAVDNDRRVVAAAALGDLVNKLGSEVLHASMPIILGNFMSANTKVREGAAYGLHEVLKTTSRQGIDDKYGAILACVKKGLADRDPKVCEYAAGAFDQLYNHLGSKLVDDVIPQLLVEMQATNGSNDVSL